MMRRNDPRIRQTWNQISQSVESANESAQANIFSFSHNYIGPCLSSLGNCIGSCTAPCFPTREERLRRQRGRSRGRPELSFDFYDDWEDDDGARDGLLGWGNDELDRLLAGSSAGQQPTGRHRAMSYGARRGKDGRGTPGARRKTVTGEGPDPTIIPRTSIFGFLRLPWKLGTNSLRYTPSVADLQEHPGSGRRMELEGEPLLEENDEGARNRESEQSRKRSDTQGSAATVESYSSRGDLFSSEDEADAIPLDDEFAVVLERRMTLSGPDDTKSSSRTRSGKRPSAGSRTSTRTSSSRDIRSSLKRSREESVSAARPPSVLETPMSEAPSMADLNREEEQARRDEEAEIERKRLAAQRLAVKHGLSVPPETTEQDESVEQDAHSQPSVPHTNPSPAELPDTTHAEPSSSENDAAASNSPASGPTASEFVPARLPHFPGS
ncbi:hypothetical protein L228DRAFT_245760 [Xylona heveae TC161]|uniref:Uncharacterized protein n=1 Tax=Xylona heveae (strain CBS 132557 / TC161) TaxID=1328760 RepID=A0A161TFF7_XYLHT|nr:hypothetical protein L228DRAFT_245760 [Xylona heveae TC161]KZF24757.1 hypothetical protein L228DRAFT_245760 [Xylona heveae TC161]